MNDRVAIIGAGIGGLTTALALARRGVSVDVYEQARAMSEIGAGLHVSPNGVKVLFGLGLEQPLMAVAAYECARLERATAIQAAAWEQGQLNHAVGRDQDGESFQGGRFADPSWIYGHDVVASFPL
jgi:2-polyprenyl-6-methoxyphenol hydroxylase-like FAD-dependent oxidoreductase